MKKTNEKGITLVALVVTIIVLLILAGVSINLLAGGDGIMAKAQNAIIQNNIAEAKERVILKVSEYHKDYYQATYVDKTSSVNVEIGDWIANAHKGEEIEIGVYKFTITDGEDENYKITILENNKLPGNIYGKLLLNGKVIWDDIEDDENLNGGNDSKPGDEEDEKTDNENEQEIVKIKINQTKKLSTVLNSGDIEWNTSDESVVTVNQSGEITGIAKGQAIVTASYKTEEEEVIEEEEDDTVEDDDAATEDEKTEQVTQTYLVIVEDGIPEEFELELENISIKQYENVLLEAKIDGKKVGANYLEWESSDENIAQIDATGKVTGVSQGEAVITCKWKSDTTKTATCKVTVKIEGTLIIDNPTMDITVNQTGKLKVNYLGTDVTNSATWESENENIVTVNKGKLNGLAIGTSKVTATYDSKKVTCEVAVREIISQIYTIEDLSLFASQVNAGQKFEGKTVEQKADLDFKSQSSYESTQSTAYKNYYTNGTTWERIGTSETLYFAGTFNGNGYKIKNLYINATVKNQGLFGYSQDATFQNVVIENADITSTSYNVGGVLGYGNGVTISNCKVSGNLNSTGHTDNYNKTGGIVGYIGTTGGNINGCVNEATVGGNYVSKAGIVGRMIKGTISDCTNKGTINSANSHAGGIIGTAGDTSNVNYFVTIDNCKNYGQIEARYDVGGIAGQMTQSSVISNSINYGAGTVIATGNDGTEDNRASAGGIAGAVGAIGNNEVKKCTNYAQISASYAGKGGIAGTLRKGTLSDCVNEGKVVGTGNYEDTGGIVGLLGYHSTDTNTTGFVENCTNKGEINTIGSCAGGIAGSITYSSEVKNCKNYEKVISTGYGADNRGCTGGIVGLMRIRGTCLIENCTNYAAVDSQYFYCGGIVGWHAKGNVKNCTNEGSVTNFRRDTGGISGRVGRYDDNYQTNGIIEGCINNGDITITSTGANACNAGGIAGSLDYGSKATISGNSGDVTTYGFYTTDDKTSRTGGVVGATLARGANVVTYCYNTGKVTASYKYIGGIAGLQNTTGALIDRCYSKGVITGPANIGGIVGYKKGTVSVSYYLQNSVVPTSGSKTNQGTETTESEIDKYIAEINNMMQ